MKFFVRTTGESMEGIHMERSPLWMLFFKSE